MINPFALDGKRVLVTGASSGIGQAVAIACAGMGAEVVITGRNEARLNDTFIKMEGEGHKVVVADLTTAEGIGALAESLPKLDGVAHCAGINALIPCKAIQEDDISSLFSTNFDAHALLQAALLTGKKIGKGASIVFIASKAAEYPVIGNAVYSATKGALISYAKCLALELAQRQIRVNCISPALVQTRLVENDSVTDESMAEVVSRYPLKRLGTPEDVANLALYLLSDASGWMTGENISIDGGGMGNLI